MEEKINAMSAAEALREWKYAKAQHAIDLEDGYSTGSAEGLRLCEKRLSELLDKHKVAVDSKKRARIEDIQLLDDASIVALLRYHQIKYS